MALTLDDIIDELVVKHGMNRVEAQDITKVFFDDIKSRLTNGESVLLPSIGRFYKNRQRYHRKRRDIPVNDDDPTWTTFSFRTHPNLLARIQRAAIEEERREQKDAEAQAAYVAKNKTNELSHQ